MKLVDIKDDNGTSLQAYAELLAEKAQERGVEIVLVLASPPDDLALITSIEVAAVPDFLSQIAAQMRKPPSATEVLQKRHDA